MTGTNAMMNRIILLTVTVIIMAGVSFSQKMHSGPLSIQAGITVFDDASDNQNSYVQFPYSVKRNQFQFISVPGTEQFKATIYAEIVLSDTLGNHLDSASTYYYTYAGNRQETENGDIKLFNNLYLILEPGKYKASLNVIDVTSKNKGSFLYERIEIDSPIPGQLRLSNIEMAHDINIVDESSANSSSPLVKNNYRIIPNPMGIYSEADSSLF
ncbi:MAG: hypothetical protein GY865_14860, partial [candidate division Zixibacteria bacterium]|nr:hypothetical protein [candidate division Zixibacteria bacterium]